MLGHSNQVIPAYLIKLSNNNFSQLAKTWGRPIVDRPTAPEDFKADPNDTAEVLVSDDDSEDDLNATDTTTPLPRPPTFELSPALEGIPSPSLPSLSNVLSNPFRIHSYVASKNTIQII